MFIVFQKYQTIGYLLNNIYPYFHDFYAITEVIL